MSSLLVLYSAFFITDCVVEFALDYLVTNYQSLSPVAFEYLECLAE
jgi:hypothetical protein